LQVTRSGFYAWQRRPESAHARRDRHLRVRVRASHDASRRAYGRPRIWKDLVEDGERISEKRVGRLMREEGIVARARRRFKVTTMSDHDQPVASNVLDRQFTADRPNQRWVGDTSEFLVGSGTKLFVAAILDLYSRYVVGWAVSAVNDRHLTIKALEMAIKRRCPEAGLLHHSDQGCTYASERLPAVADDARHHLQYEPTRQLLRQRGDGEFLLDREVRTRRALRQLRRSQDAVVRLHRSVL
jgi:putative transposase